MMARLLMQLTLLASAGTDDSREANTQDDNPPGYNIGQSGLNLAPLALIVLNPDHWLYIMAP